ncbi:hypothetical protein GCM10011351_11970 [Paraliobacillus quinghaiensis]|uniref:Uncharacterized protein n=1 Tax=Paraliobacillus quinghaiensis TaxID=470815 RepID=A0A917WSH9_9BACI|nr:hypothetical protein GCM10011351_11970 [Paraliobacillus quinghaiensis]
MNFLISTIINTALPIIIGDCQYSNPIGTVPSIVFINFIQTELFCYSLISLLFSIIILLIVLFIKNKLSCYD